MYEIFFVNLQPKSGHLILKGGQKFTFSVRSVVKTGMSEERNESKKVATVMGTGDAVGVENQKKEDSQEPAKFWFIARVAPNTEKSSRKKLEHLGYKVFVASQMEHRLWKNGDRKKKTIVERVVITQYIFILASEPQLGELITYSFIKEFVRDSATGKKEFAYLKEREMECLQQMFGQTELPVGYATHIYKKGDSVQVHFGSYNYSAQIIRLRDANATYVGLRIKELGYAYMEAPLGILSPQ